MEDMTDSYIHFLLDKDCKNHLIHKNNDSEKGLIIHGILCKD